MSYAIIDENTINYSEIDKTHGRFKIDNLMDDIEDFIHVHNCTDITTAMEDIILKCNFDPDDIINTTIIKESENFVYYMIHTIDDNTKKKDINGIAMILSKKLFRITGSVGIIKESFNCSSNSNSFSPVSMQNILDIYHKNLVFDAVKINHDGSFDVVNYIYNPIDWTKPEESLNYKFVEFELFGKIIMVFIELNPKNNFKNETASTLLGKNIYGHVIVSMRDKIDDILIVDNRYESIDTSVLKKIIYISKYQGTPHENVTLKIDNFYTKLWNTHRSLVSTKNKIQKQIPEGDMSFNEIIKKGLTV